MWAPISLMVPYCENCLLPNWASWGLWGGGVSIVRRFFLRSIFSGGALSTFIHLSLGRASPFTFESHHIHVKALKMQGCQRFSK